MNIKSIFTIKENTVEAVDELKSQLGNFDPKLIVYFGSIEHKPEVISSKMNQSFPNVELIGCSSAGGVVSGAMHDQGIMAMAFNEEAIQDVHIEIIKDITKNRKEKVKSAFHSFEKKTGLSSNQWDHEKMVGLILSNALLNAEEEIMETIGSLTNVFFVGGSAADNLSFSENYTYVNGEFFTDATVLVLMDSKLKFEIIKTQNFTSSGDKMVVTGANPDIREVYELDNKPILEVYSEKLGVPVEEVPEHFFLNPLGIATDEGVYLRSVIKNEDGKLLLACSLMEGMEVEFSKHQDIIKETEKALKKACPEPDKVAGLMQFNCAYRLVEINQFNVREEYGQLFKDFPTTGMNAFGECFLGHINQTATMLIFKND